MHRRRGPRHNPCRPICTSSPISAACAAGSNGKGCTFTFSYYGDAFDNPFGGVKQGPGYDSRFAIIMDGDLDKLAGWSGAKFHASIHSIFGNAIQRRQSRQSDAGEQRGGAADGPAIQSLDRAGLDQQRQIAHRPVHGRSGIHRRPQRRSVRQQHLRLADAQHAGPAERRPELSGSRARRPPANRIQRPVHSAGRDFRRRSGRIRLQQSGDERQIWARFPRATIRLL